MRNLQPVSRERNHGAQAVMCVTAEWRRDGGGAPLIKHIVENNLSCDRVQTALPDRILRRLAATHSESDNPGQEQVSQGHARERTQTWFVHMLRTRDVDVAPSASSYPEPSAKPVAVACHKAISLHHLHIHFAHTFRECERVAMTTVLRQ